MLPSSYAGYTEDEDREDSWDNNNNASTRKSLTNIHSFSFRVLQTSNSNDNPATTSSRQGTRHFVRGRLGNTMFKPPSTTTDQPDNNSNNTVTANPMIKAAEAEASTGSWLRDLESGEKLPRIVPPGMTRGAYGPWKAEGDGDNGGGHVSHGIKTEEDGDGTNKREAAGAVDTVEEEHESGMVKDGKIVLENLFSGIWMMQQQEEEEEEEENVDDDEVAGVETLTTQLKEPTSVVIDTILSLPADTDLPGSVSSFGTTGTGSERRGGQGVLSLKRQHKSDGGGIAKDDDEEDLFFNKTPHHRGKDKYALKASIPNLDTTFQALQPTMARTWPFELDTFQKEAIICMEQNKSVFVAAHTSAGKTVVAEYALALCNRHCTRAIYTSPIKTISNQKFRDFTNDGMDVGLLTGDVSIKPDSDALIMTTEILRSMLYRGADIIRDIEWVVFDEVHYVNDAERGVVWEEVIIMLPAHVKLVLLSATVPNVMEFAGWVGRTRGQPMYVTATTKRPVPLEFDLYFNNKMFTVCRGDVYDAQGFRGAREVLKKKVGPVPATRAEAQRALPTGRGGGGGGGRGGGYGGGGGRGAVVASKQQLISKSLAKAAASGGGGGATISPQMRQERSQWMQLIDLLKNKELLPCVVFCFSKKRCDTLADNLSTFDMTTSAEKSEIHVFFEKSLSRLTGSDKQLPQVMRVRDMLKKGLGVHHAGLLPIVKEIVEMLFCRGLVSVLFCTETFAMGVNAPARTVIFHSLRKHDGTSFRGLLPGEFTQMSGRAGRRGLDKIGTVILPVLGDELPEEGDVRRLLTGAATKLESQFRLTYIMILNLLRVEDLKVEDMLKKSFAEFHAQRAVPEVARALEKGRRMLGKMRARQWPVSPLGTSREEVEEYAEVCEGIAGLDGQLQEAVMGSRAAQAALVPGRIVLVITTGAGAESSLVLGVTELGVVLATPSSSLSNTAEREYTVLMLHRPSPLEHQQQKKDEGTLVIETEKPVDARKKENEPVARLISKKKADGDDLLLMGMGGKKKGGGGDGGGKKGGSSMPASSLLPPLPLPHINTSGGTSFKLASIPASSITGISHIKIKITNVDEVLGGHPGATAAAVNAVLTVKEESSSSDGGKGGGGGGPAMLDPITDLKLNSIELVGSVREKQRLMALRSGFQCHDDRLLPEMMALVRSERVLAGRLAVLAKRTGDAGLAQLPEFNVRVKVLQELGYLDEERTVTLKGRVACEINSGDELVATEMLFGGVLTKLTPQEAVAVLSALVFQEKTDAAEEASLPLSLQTAREETYTLAYAAAEAQEAAGLGISPDDFLSNTLNFGLMEVVYEWAKGTPFSEICSLTDVMEGSIVRSILRLDETCREIRDAARVMGNMTLYKQMEEASVCIKRDVIFAASLYVA